MFTDEVMMTRDNRLKQAKKNSERCEKDLRKDREALERKEKLLVIVISFNVHYEDCLNWI